MKAGTRLVLSCESSVTHVALIFLLLDHGISPLLVSPDSSGDERDRYARQLDARWYATIGPDEILKLQRIPCAHEQSAETKVHSVGIYILTSGSTGEPVMVFRSLASWHHESVRYRTLLNLHAGHSITVAAPLHHAYSLGWIWAAAEAGCLLQIFAPTQLGAILKALLAGTTHCALTPFVAKLLALRGGSGDRPEQLEVVMAGAGPVDAALDEQFHAAFGLGLSRNYGSTESGALFAGLAPLPPQSIGQPMPNIRLVTSNSGDTTFMLDVELEDGCIFHTGDLVRRDQDNFYMVGRATMAIRRGERWISPSEIESVLVEHPTVTSCRVRAVPSDRIGNDHILASIVLHEGLIWDEAALRKFCEGRLARAKLPDRFEQVGLIAHGSNGKVLPSKVYQLASASVLADAAHAYKRSHLLFALKSAAVLELLNGRRSVDQIAITSGVNADALSQALELARMLGLVEDTGHGTASIPAEVGALLSLECLTSQSWNSVDELLSVLRNGSFARSFDTALPIPQFSAVYQAAMRGDGKRMSRMLAIRKLLQIKEQPLVVLDISATSGAYSHSLLERGLLDPLRSRYVMVGGLNDESAEPPGVSGTLTVLVAEQGGIDLIVLDNATHQGAIAHHLAALCDRLNSDGILLVDDFFIEEGCAAIGVDWFSHGGLHFPSRTALDAALHGLGFKALDILKTNTTAACHNVAIFTRK